MNEVEENYITQLRDCFNAGYQFPQYCIDNQIKKPLIVGTDESQKRFLWEIYAQFKYDGRIQPTFAFLNGELKIPVSYSVELGSIRGMNVTNISKMSPDSFDKIIYLTTTENSKHSNNIYLEELVNKFTRRTYLGIPLLHFIKNTPNVRVITMNSPWLSESPANTSYEKYLLKRIAEHNDFNVVGFRKVLEIALSKKETIETPWDFLGYSNETVYKLLEVVDQKVAADGSTYLPDNEFLGIKNGHRTTANQPEHYKNTIYFIGNCIYYGIGVPWNKTVASHLQNLLNKHDLSYRVENYSQFISNRNQDKFKIMNGLKFKPGDIVFVSGYRTDSIDYLQMAFILNRPHNYGECFPDRIHINENGHRAVADYIFKYLKENNFFQDIEFNYPPPHCLLIVMVSRKNLFQPRQIFCKIRSLKNTKINFEQKEYQSAA